MLRRSFAALGTTVELLLDAPAGPPADEALTAAERELRRLEALLSRFAPDSELSRLNEAGAFDGSAELVEVVRLALEARERTGGLFDPTVHDAVAAAGYDRTFAEVAADGPAAVDTPACGGAVLVDGSRIVLAPGVRLDLGGIAKGYAVDRACRLLAAAGPCLVNAGGDLAAHGGPWPVAVEDGPTLAVADAALATSGRDRRRWRRGGRERHHLIDPRTGRPAVSELLRVTVAAPSAVEAEVLAKAAFLGGAVDCPRVLVSANGRTVLAGGIA
jgi:thiamine biosynthesis lipoprotein